MPFFSHILHIPCTWVKNKTEWVLSLQQKKKSRRHAAYVDHDRLDYESGGRWSGYQGGLAEEDENYDTHYQGSSHYARKRHAPRDSYYYVGSSPPGLYDSPSEESDDE